MSNSSLLMNRRDAVRLLQEQVNLGDRLIEKLCVSPLTPEEAIDQSYRKMAIEMRERGDIARPSGRVRWEEMKWARDNEVLLRALFTTGDEVDLYQEARHGGSPADRMTTVGTLRGSVMRQNAQLRSVLKRFPPFEEAPADTENRGDEDADEQRKGRPDSITPRSQEEAQTRPDRDKTPVQDAYCIAITHKGDPRDLSKVEYQALLKNKSRYDMFVDGFTRKALCREEGRGRKPRPSKLTPKELGLLAEYVDERKPMRPCDTKGMGRWQSAQAACRVFESARKKVDVRRGRKCEWRAFRTVPNPADRWRKSYVFDPPKDFRYCLIIPRPE